MARPIGSISERTRGSRPTERAPDLSMIRRFLTADRSASVIHVAVEAPLDRHHGMSPPASGWILPPLPTVALDRIATPASACFWAACPALRTRHSVLPCRRTVVVAMGG